MDKHQKIYGYNFESIRFPFKDDPQMQVRWLERLRGQYEFPDKFVSEYKEGSKCMHAMEFSSSDNNLYKESNNFVLYSELIEKVFEIPIYAAVLLVLVNVYKGWMEQSS